MPLFASRLEQEAGEAFIVFDDQQHLIARLDVVTIVACLVDELVADAVSGVVLRQDGPMSVSVRPACAALRTDRLAHWRPRGRAFPARQTDDWPWAAAVGDVFRR